MKMIVVKVKMIWIRWKEKKRLKKKMMKMIRVNNRNENELGKNVERIRLLN